jgi:hypothetical protein
MDLAFTSATRREYFPVGYGRKNKHQTHVRELGVTSGLDQVPFLSYSACAQFSRWVQVA